MPTAKKLKSGSWNCLAYSHTEEITLPDGSTKQKRIYKSFTCDDKSLKGKKKCEMMAVEWSLNRENHTDADNMTFGQAMDSYINERSEILSPASIRKYRNMQRNRLKSLENIKLEDLDQTIIQTYINNLSMELSPKSIRDTHGLITAVIKRYLPNKAFNTSLPKKVQTEYYIPSDSDIHKLLTVSKGSKIEIAIYLAAFGSLRRGEIAALTADDVNGNTIHVNKTMVKSPNGEWIVKPPKSFAGDRYVTLPDFVIKKLPKHGRIVDMPPHKIYINFQKQLDKAELPHFRFHDLRHYNASILHALGVPDAYIMARGGWQSDRVLKGIYRHTMEDTQRKADMVVTNHFEKIMQDEMQDENEKHRKKP